MACFEISRREVLKGAGGAALITATPAVARRAVAQTRGGALVLSSGYYPLGMDLRMLENGEGGHGHYCFALTGTRFCGSALGNVIPEAA